MYRKALTKLFPHFVTITNNKKWCLFVVKTYKKSNEICPTAHDYFLNISMRLIRSVNFFNYPSTEAEDQHFT